MRQSAALALFSLISHAKQTLNQADGAPAGSVSAKAKSLPTACDVYCPARAVCERCWRGRCDYEGQEQLCFGCAESACFNERVLQAASYRDAKQKSTTAAIALAAAAALNQNEYNTVDGQGANDKSKNPRQGGSRNRALVIIQNDRTSRVTVTDDTVDFHPTKANTRSKNRTAPALMSASPTVIAIPPNTSNDRRRAGHLPDAAPQLSAIVDQRVWVPVPVATEAKFRQRLAHDDASDDIPTSSRPIRSRSTVERSPAPSAPSPPAAPAYARASQLGRDYVSGFTDPAPHPPEGPPAQAGASDRAISERGRTGSTDVTQLAGAAPEQPAEKPTGPTQNAPEKIDHEARADSCAEESGLCGVPAQPEFVRQAAPAPPIIAKSGARRPGAEGRAEREENPARDAVVMSEKVSDTKSRVHAVPPLPTAAPLEPAMAAFDDGGNRQEAAPLVMVATEAAVQPAAESAVEMITAKAPKSGATAMEDADSSGGEEMSHADEYAAPATTVEESAAVYPVAIASLGESPRLRRGGLVASLLRPSSNRS